ncbi:glycogen/starch synthase [Estrella lausannensis]|nr:glycogen/starch synthase [Estrella lausannensis]
MYAPPETQVEMTAQNFDIWLTKLSALKDAYGMSALDQLSELYKKKCNVLFEITRLRVLQNKLSSKELNESVEELTKEFIDTTKTYPPHAEIERETLGSIISNALASLEENTLSKIDSLVKDLINSVYDEFALHQVSAERLLPLIPKEEIAKPLSVTMIGAEFTGFVKEGGLAEALEGMTKGLKAQNQENKVRVILPNFSTFPASIKEKISLNPPLNFQTAEGVEYSVSILNQDGIDFYLINHPCFKLKGEKASIYGPDDETVKRRFVTFTNLAADLAKRTPTDVIHLHDWHVAGVALKLKKENPKNWKTGTVPPIVFTYHNNSRGAQGRLSSSGIYNYDSVVQGLIEAGIASEKVNVFAEVLKVADCVTTVSETFAIESQEVETGEGVSFAVREAARMGKLTGIINGSNPHSWNPEEDNTLKHWRGSDGSEIDLSYHPNLSPLKISSKKIFG